MHSENIWGFVSQPSLLISQYGILYPGCSNSTGKFAWPDKVFVLIWWRWSQDSVRWYSQYSHMQIYRHCGDLENNILIIRINILARWDPLALTQGPGRCCALPKVTLGLVLQNSISAPPFYAAPGKEPLLLTFHAWLSLLHLLFVFICAVLHSASLFFFCFRVIWLCLTVQLSCYIVLACHFNGILSQSVTPPSILYFYVTLLNTSFLRWRAADMTQGSLFKAYMKRDGDFFFI